MRSEERKLWRRLGEDPLLEVCHPQHEAQCEDPMRPEEEYKLRVQKIAREVFLKQREVVKDLKSATIREEEKAEISLQLIKMITDSHLS
jgi:hypothetical protein